RQRQLGNPQRRVARFTDGRRTRGQRGLLRSAVPQSSAAVLRPEDQSHIQRAKGLLLMTPFSKRTLLMALAALPAAGLIARPARADIEVNVNRGDVQPLPIAIPAFGGGQVGADIAGVISANLQRSGLFRPLDPASFIERDLNTAVQPRFAAWKQINAQALVNGQVTVAGARLQVDFRLWDV